MRLTTKGRFAVTAMMDIALEGRQVPVTLAAIAERREISLSYLEQLFGKLRRHRLVQGLRGPGGGYTLTRRLEDITVAEIVRAVDEPLDATQCGGRENCVHGHRCITHGLWEELNHTIDQYLSGITLAALVTRHARDAAAAAAASTPVVASAVAAMTPPHRAATVRLLR